MKNKQITLGGSGSLARTAVHEAEKSWRKKLPIERAETKLQAATKKTVTKTSQDMSQKLTASLTEVRADPKLSCKDRSCSSETSTPGKSKLVAQKTSTPGKSKLVAQKTSADDGAVTERDDGAVTERKPLSRARKHKSDKEEFMKCPSDAWAVASLGKREASLNASMKVNIFYERHTSSKSSKMAANKTKATALDLHKNEKMRYEVSGTRVLEESSSFSKTSVAFTECSSPGTRGDTTHQQGCKKSVQKLARKKAQSNPSSSNSRKRKSPTYKIFKDELPKKNPKIEKKSSVKSQNRNLKRIRKSVPSGHQLCNIIEKCPRQASLVAKAMIAMGQEDNIVCDSSARTRVYQWIEQRPLKSKESRKIVWHGGLGDFIIGKNSMNNVSLQATSDNNDVVDVTTQDNPQAAASLDNESLCDTQSECVLRKLHETENFRSHIKHLREQSEDFLDLVDVENCSTPDKQTWPSPDPMNCLPSSEVDDKLDRVVNTPIIYAPAKSQLCQVVTPVPKFSCSQRSGNIGSNFIHHTITQPTFPHQPLHAHPQPMKASPFMTDSTFVHQYTLDHPQTGLYNQLDPIHMRYEMSKRKVTCGDCSPAITYSPTDDPKMGGPDVKPFQMAACNTSLHLPMQQIESAYGAYYHPSISAVPQHNLSALPTLPLHQQYPLVQTSVVTQHQVHQNLGQPDCSSCPLQTSLGHDANCTLLPCPATHIPKVGPPLVRLPPMGAPSVGHASVRHASVGPPPVGSPLVGYSPVGPLSVGPPPLQMRQAAISYHTETSPIDSVRLFNPPGVRQAVKPPTLGLSPNFMFCHGNHNRQLSDASCRHHHQLQGDQSGSSFKHSVLSNGQNKNFSLCKKEHEEVSGLDCELITKNFICDDQCPPRSYRADSESSNISDLLHSAHTAVYQTDGLASLENFREFHQIQVNSTSGACSPSRACSPFRINVTGHTSSNTACPVSSVHDVLGCKVKPEPGCNMCVISQLPNVEQRLLEQPHSAFVFFTSAGLGDGSDSRDTNITPHKHYQKNNLLNRSTNHLTLTFEDRGEGSKTKSIIVIKDSDDSSDDEPLARMVIVKSADGECHLSKPTVREVHQNVKEAHQNVSSTRKYEPSTMTIPVQQSRIRAKEKNKRKATSASKTRSTDFTELKRFTSVKFQSPANIKCVPVKQHLHSKSIDNHVRLQNLATSSANKCQIQSDKETKSKSAHKKSSLSSNHKAKKPTKKVILQPVLPQTPVKTNVNHGWTWIGEGQLKPVPKLTSGREEAARVFKSYQSMQHSSGEVVSLHDCVILQSDGDASIPFVAKVSALWENMNGEMMFSMLWYYQPEHTAVGREADDGEQELFASKHREENSVACIDDKCFVLLYNEYCRLEAESARQRQGVPLPRWRQLMPTVTEDEHKFCRPPLPANVCVDNVWFCRYDYDIRKKIVKKPRNKKCNLRYRAPNKM